MPEYEVTIGNIFDADTPEDAVKQMVAWLDESAANGGYRATSVLRPSDTVFIDAEDLDWR